MKCFNLSIIFVVVFVGYTKADKFPSFITPCKRNDSNLSECIKNVTKLLTPKLKGNIPELGLKSVEALLLKEGVVNIGSGNGPLNLKIIFKNAKIHGISNSDIKDINFDFDKNLLNFSTHAPLITIEGDSMATGKLFSSQVNGKSSFLLDLEDLAISATFILEKFTKNGEDHFKITNNVVETDVKTTVRLETQDNLFDGNNQVSDEISNVLEENIDLLYKEIEPVIKEVWSNLCVKYFNIVFDKFSINELFPLE